MNKIYEVIDIRTDRAATIRVTTSAKSPEAAALDVLGVEVVRSGIGAQLAAKVYWHNAQDSMNLVRLYIKVGSRPPR